MTTEASFQLTQHFSALQHNPVPVYSEVSPTECGQKGLTPRKKKTSFQVVSSEEDLSTRGEIHKDAFNYELTDTIEMKKHPVITRVSLMFTPDDFKRDDSTSSSSQTSNEARKQQQENSASQQQDNPRTLRMLLRQKDLEIKGLKNAAQRHPSDRLARILHELVKPRSKGLQKRCPSEDKFPKGVEQVNSQLEAIKKSHRQEMKQLEDKLIKSHLLIRHLQETVKTLSMKSDDEPDTESSSSLDEGTQLARESFELWSESGTKILPEASDLRLRRIPKHTSFVDAFHRFGSISLSDEEKDEVISHVESGNGCITENSSEESLKTESKLLSEQSSLAVLVSPNSEKSDFTSSDTKVSQSTLSLPSLVEKSQPSYSIDLGHSLDSWSYVPPDSTPEQPADGAMVWMPLDHGASVPFMEESKRCHTATGSLKIVSVHSKGKFVRIFNSLLNKEVNLSGYIIQQWIGGCPVSIYRFPSGTILPAQHHITVWAAGANLAHKRPAGTLDLQKFFKAGPKCTTILCDPRGQTVSQYVAPHRFSAAAEAYSDNVDLSVDKFPLTEKEEEPDESLPSRTERHLSLPRQELVSPSDNLLQKRHQRLLSIDSSTSKTGNGRSIAIKKKSSDASSESSTSTFFSSKSLPPLLVKESQSSTSQEGYFASQTWQPLLEEPKAREFKTTLDTTLPMVALIGQKSARSKYGFKYMTYIPITTDLPLRRYCPAKMKCQ